MDPAQQTTVLTVMLAAVSALASFGSAWLGYLGTRDRLRYDAKITELGLKVEVCNQERDELKAQNADQQHQINDQQHQINDLRDRLDRREAKP